MNEPILWIVILGVIVLYAVLYGCSLLNTKPLISTKGASTLTVKKVHVNVKDFERMIAYHKMHIRYTFGKDMIKRHREAEQEFKRQRELLKKRLSKDDLLNQDYDSALTLLWEKQMDEFDNIEVVTKGEYNGKKK